MGSTRILQSLYSLEDYALETLLTDCRYLTSRGPEALSIKIPEIYKSWVSFQRLWVRQEGSHLPSTVCHRPRPYSSQNTRIA